MLTLTMAIIGIGLDPSPTFTLLSQVPAAEPARFTGWIIQQPFFGALIGALVGGAVSAIGWYVSWKKEQSGRRQEASLRHLQRQIEEFYGPLRGLIVQSRTIYEVAKKDLPKRDDGRLNVREFTHDEHRRWNHFVDSYLRPLNQQVSDLIRTKLYLVEGGVLPESFEKFLEHAAQSEAVHSLRDQGSGRLGDVWVPYPVQFETDVKKTLDFLVARYQSEIQASFSGRLDQRPRGSIEAGQR
ncbi:MAG: hypothetical protein M3220_12260 [Chloroflexota bacterium]|nr:hypothetical protein [Chloroflexota bacterium]